MTKTSTYTGSALLNLLNDRMLKYKALATAFSYPEKKELFSEYDRLFRQNELWLYGLAGLFERRREDRRDSILGKDRDDLIHAEIRGGEYGPLEQSPQ